MPEQNPLGHHDLAKSLVGREVFVYSRRNDTFCRAETTIKAYNPASDTVMTWDGSVWRLADYDLWVDADPHAPDVPEEPALPTTETVRDYYIDSWDHYNDAPWGEERNGARAAQFDAWFAQFVPAGSERETALRAVIDEAEKLWPILNWSAARERFELASTAKGARA